MGRTRRIIVEVEVPEGLDHLSDEALAGMARAALERRLLLLKELEELIPEPIAGEEEIMELDRILKRALARRLEDELSKDSG
ncbi:MAG: hypothetical protein GSR80_000767 [Desulfurococcales archaeon]|nr:hypothetical protein [Desulfurococcales archaeon]